MTTETLRFGTPKPRKVPRGFFIAVHPVVMALVIAGLYLVTMSWISPHGVSTKIFGQISDLVAYLGTNYNWWMKMITISAAIAHVLEMFAALFMCYKLNLKRGVTCLWVIQTFFFGIFSLRYLLWPQNALVNLYTD